MTSKLEKLINQSWFLKSSNEEEQTCVLSCGDLDVHLEYNEMFDEFVPADDEYCNPVALIMCEQWWEKVQPILDGDTERV